MKKNIDIKISPYIISCSDSDDSFLKKKEKELIKNIKKIRNTENFKKIIKSINHYKWDGEDFINKGGTIPYTRIDFELKTDPDINEEKDIIFILRESYNLSLSGIKIISHIYDKDLLLESRFENIKKEAEIEKELIKNLKASGQIENEYEYYIYYSEPDKYCVLSEYQLKRVELFIYEQNFDMKDYYLYQIEEWSSDGTLLLFFSEKEDKHEFAIYYNKEDDKCIVYKYALKDIYDMDSLLYGGTSDKGLELVEAENIHDAVNTGCI